MSSIPKTIGTHNGTFHCDEALAVNLLLKTVAFAGSTVIRTRDEGKLAQCSVVVDVGAVYDPATCRYDHHQRSFKETFSPKHETKLSSAGLVYKHYGREIVADTLSLAEDHPDVNVVYNRMYDYFIEALDACDNGISQYPSDITPRYKETTTLPSRVSTLNPAWNQTGMDIDAQFMKAVALTGEEFLNKLNYIGKSWLPARELVVSALARKRDVHPSGKILVFERACPWKDHLEDLEKEQFLTEDELPVYVLFPEGDDESRKWRIQAVPKSPSSFETRKAMPEAWGGLRDSELSTIANIPGCVFVHAGRWIGGNQTKEGALRMAVAALEA